MDIHEPSVATVSNKKAAGAGFSTITICGADGIEAAGEGHVQPIYRYSNSIILQGIYCKIHD